MKKNQPSSCYAAFLEKPLCREQELESLVHPIIVTSLPKKVWIVCLVKEGVSNCQAAASAHIYIVYE